MAVRDKPRQRPATGQGQTSGGGSTFVMRLSSSKAYQAESRARIHATPARRSVTQRAASSTACGGAEPAEERPAFYTQKTSTRLLMNALEGVARRLTGSQMLKLQDLRNPPWVQPRFSSMRW